MSSVSSIFASTSNYQGFVDILVALEGQKKVFYEVEQEELQESKRALGTINSDITELEKIIEEFTSPLNNSPFEKFKASVDDDSGVTIDSVENATFPTNYDITVSQLAKNDVALDISRVGTATDLSAFGDGSVDITIGSKTETINVATTKDDGSGGTVAMTNEEILQAFADAITTAFEDEAVANVFSNDGTNVQFSMESVESGFDNRIQFGTGSGVVSQILSSTTKLNAESELNAIFTVDGVQFERSKNSITDAVDNLEFTLTSVSGNTERISVTRDTDAAKDELNRFIDAYNELTTTIRERTFINGETGNAGPLQDYRSIRNMSTTLQQTILLDATGITGDNLKNITQLGYIYNDQGELELDDEDALDAFLENNPDQITAFFEDSTSPITQITSLLETFSEEDGVIDSIEDGFDSRLDRLTDLIRKEELFLIEYEEEQTLYFNELDALLEQGRNQFNQVTAITSTLNNN
ncbi:MAG: flagellar filament capping protein FliD [Balneolales bacterium]|nr:flagellar filament capping protein FliD [Balneolales bacterium]